MPRSVNNSPTRERVALEFKAVSMPPMQVSDTDRVVKAIYAVMGNEDMYADVIMPGAFVKTIADRLPTGNIKVLWQHDMDWPAIATPLVLRELAQNELPTTLRQQFPTATGALYGEVQYLDTPRADEVLAGIRGGALTQNSIGFDVIRCSYQDADGQALGPGDFPMGMFGPTFDPDMQRIIQEVRLWDISPVNFGANNATMNIKAGYLPQPYQQDPDETVQCQVCGRMNDTDAMYCDQCGAAIPGGPSTPYTVHFDETIQCPQCQRMNDVDARYCDQCDYKLAGSLDVAAQKRLQFKAAIPYKKTGVDLDGAWDINQMLKNIRATGADLATAMRAFAAWVDPEADAQTKGAYKFGHHDVSPNGQVGDANYKACVSGIGVLNGGMGGANIPDADRTSVYNHLAKHITDGGKEPPELKSLNGPDGVYRQIWTFSDFFARNEAELKAGRVLSDANYQRLKAAHEHISAVLTAAESSPSNDEKTLTAEIERMMRDVQLAEFELSLTGV